MPAAAISQPSARTVQSAAPQKPRATTQTKRRAVRRRGRGRDDLDSDDEIVREAATDSESDDHPSDSDSATDDSDTEPASDDVPHDRTHLPTPRNSKSPESVVKEEAGPVNGGVPSFFAPSGDWADMVTEEKLDGPADLPIIDFTDFGNRPTVPARKSKKANKSNRPPQPRATPVQPEEVPQPVDASEPQPRVPDSQSARQAYQHKLETDPSFVPTIGNFWGHDDRLIDSEFRSLSGWWRGRGRGRGSGFMRGRGGIQGGQSRSAPGDNDPSKEVDVPPIERAWTHDGFEEMKKKEDQRRTEQASARQSQQSPKRGGFAGRGGFVGRGGFMRGGFTSSARGRNTSPFPQPNRIRFAVKPELMWTKQHEAFLYFETALKPRPGQGPGFRVKIPGHQPQVVRAPPRAAAQPSTSKVSSGSSVQGGDNYFVVRLPQRSGKEKEVAVVDKQTEKTTSEDSSTAQAQSTTSNATPPSKPTSTTEVPASSPLQQVLPEPTTRSQLELLSLEPQASNPERQAKTELAVLRKPSSEAAVEVQIVSPVAERPTLPPLQTTFTPPPPPPQLVSQPSPAYGSPYGYTPPLPPGIAMNAHGMPYEVATGRPVYLQAPAMYNPRPMIPSHIAPGPFVPGHMHHHSSVSVSAVSPDFLAQPPSHTPPVNGFIDPATGTPIFSFPRQTTRVEIRAPTDELGKPVKAMSRTPSGLRTTAPTFQPTFTPARTTSAQGNAYYPSPPSDATLPAYDNLNGHGSMEDGSQAAMPGMMGYHHYQQPYYYPEPYGYAPYVDMSQGGQYDMYMDQTPQGTVYYQ